MSDKSSASSGGKPGAQQAATGASGANDLDSTTVNTIPPVKDAPKASGKAPAPSPAQAPKKTGLPPKPNAMAKPPVGSASTSASDATAPMPVVGAATQPSPAPVPAAPASPVVPEVKPDPVRRTRKARLRLTRVDPWSVMKTAFLFSVAFGIMVWIGVYVVWGVIEASGLFDSMNQMLTEVLGNPESTSTFQVQDFIGVGQVMGYTTIISVVNVVIITALTTLFAFLYNLSATVLGGLEVTLAED